MTRRRAQLAAVIACALGAVLLAGCHASATVAIRVRADGRGTVAVDVALDRDATLALEGGVAKPGGPDIPLGDLRARRWSVVVRSATGGGTSVSLSKPFTGGADLAAVLAELDGTKGALRDVHVVRTRALLSDRDSVSLLVDLRNLRSGVSDDPALDARLRAAGIDVAALDAGLTARLQESFDLTVRVELPDGSHGSVRVVPGQQQTIGASSSTDHPGRRAALAAAAAAALLGLVLLVAGSLRARRRRRRRA